MKKVIAIILGLALLVSGVLAENVNTGAAPGSPMELAGGASAGEMLGFGLLHGLYSSGENSIVSPYSLALALGMAAEGAEGETLRQILDALGVENLQAVSSVLPEGISSANAAFTKPGMPLNEEYSAKLNEYYGAEWFEIDGKVVKKVNSWVQEKTDGLIDSMLSEAPDEQTGMLLLNAVAMDADWAKPFFETGTWEESFHAAEGDVTVQMMHQTDRFRYAEKDGVQIICLPYFGNGLEMWIAMPAAEGEEGLQMAELMEVLAAEGSFYLTSDAQMEKVELALPKFDVSDDNSLAQLLQEMGMNLPFDSESAQFGGISETPLYIGEIFQKARVQVDEAGTKAAASTMVAMAMMAAPGMQDEPAVMTVDRPFLFMISDSESGVVCFAGVVENPEK